MGLTSMDRPMNIILKDLREFFRNLLRLNGLRGLSANRVSIFSGLHVARSAVRGKPGAGAYCFTYSNSSQQLFMETVKKYPVKRGVQ